MWDTVRNVGALIGLISAVYGLWKLYAGRLRIKARGHLNTLRLLPNAEKDAEAFIDKLRELRRETHTAERAALDSLVSSAPKTLFGDFFAGELFKNVRLWTIDVENAGKAEAKDLILHTRLKGFCSTDRDKNNAVAFDKDITLGSLRAKGSVTVWLWTSDHTSEFDAKNIHVTHSAGDVPLAYGRLIYGKTGSMAGAFQSSPGTFLLFCLFGCMAGAGLVSSIIGSVMKAAAPSAPSAPQSQPTTQP